MIEKQIVEILAPLADRIIELEKQLAEIAMRPVVKSEPVDVQAIAREAAKILPAPDNGKDGVSIKSVTLTDGHTMTVELTDGAEFEVELPVGPAGAQGERGERGEKGIDGLGIEVKAWGGNVTREGVYVACELGKIYKALRDTATAPGGDDWERVGSFGFAWKGLKREGAQYEDGDLYIDGGTTFLWFGGKGHIFAQKGARGAQGERGTDGKDAPTIIHARWTAKSVEMVLSDGEVLEAEVEGYQKAVADLSREIVYNFLEERDAAAEAQGGTPVKSFRGPFVRGDSYSKGDLVTFNKSMWVARASTKGEFSDQVWRQMITVVSGGAGGHIKLTSLADINQHSKPALGEMPIWTYATGQTSSQGQFVWATPSAHIKTWDSTRHWESGATVLHDGRLWRATHDNSNVEPKFEEGKITLFIKVPGEPSFGIVPMGLGAAAPPSGPQDLPPSKYAYYVEYTAPSTFSIWKFIVKGANPQTHKPYGEWEGRPWQCIVWRGITPPPPSPPGIVMVWLYGPPTSTHAPVLGQQQWAPLDLQGSITTSVDVAADAPKDNDILVYNASTHKWTAVAGKTWWTSMQTSP